MAKYSLHGGHNSIVQGANWGNRKEHVMDRQVKDAVAAKLRALGHTVYDDTDETGSTQAQNLSNIVRNCNSHSVDLVISFHLNSYNGAATGVEVCYYDQQALAAKVSAQLSKDVGWPNRGAKERKELYVLANTKAPAILIELGFIDNDSDMAKWDVNKIANSIVYALTGQISDGGGNTQPPEENDNVLGYLTTTAEVANIRKEPNLNSPVMRQAVKGQGHTYYDWYYDGSNFWYKVAENNWMRDDIASINKDGKSKGVVWVNGTNINLRKGASTGDAVINKITKQSAYDVHYRYEDWIYVTGEGVEGWMYFDESYVKWIR
ncbi:N-acetylmuramoyl-L-alanine amidase [Bacillus anthracis]|nr:N-acetylmuramoyl-L-alanine amidase [Bacillus anthracis]